MELSLQTVTRGARRARDELVAARALNKAGFFERDPPAVTRKVLGAIAGYGQLGASVQIAALRHPQRTGLIDELGSLTFSELDARSNAVAWQLRARGIGPGDGVAILARNHRGFWDALLGGFKLGARMVLLNTDFAGPQVRDVAGRENARLLICDEEYEEFVSGYEPELGRLVAWTDTPREDSLQALIDSATRFDAPGAPKRKPSLVILTSGTTGAPKGANRNDTRTLTLVGAVLERVPFRGGDVTDIAAPVFHSHGLLALLVALGTSSTAVVRRRFDADAVLDDIEAHRCTGLICVPIMLQRIVDAQEARHRDVSSLKLAFIAGSQLGASLATRGLDALGEVVFNLYGSTEVAMASIATPADLRAAPETVGRPTIGTRVALYDEHDHRVPEGQTGRIFVANAIPFEGYTGGGGKAMVDGLLSSGDVGHFDSAGRLFIDGRDDAMIVSGGENVFPDEVEELLTSHPAIDEATVLGVPDEKFGQRLRAFVVLRDGEKLTEDEVKAYVRENLARFKVPRDVVFLDAMPRNPTGKILKRELEDYAAEPTG